MLDGLPIFINEPTRHEFRDGMFYTTAVINEREFIMVRTPSVFIKSAYSALESAKEFMAEESEVLRLYDH